LIQNTEHMKSNLANGNTLQRQSLKETGKYKMTSFHRNVGTFIKKKRSGGGGGPVLVSSPHTFTVLVGTRKNGGILRGQKSLSGLCNQGRYCKGKGNNKK
jgi:hypothetical protein